MADVVDPQQPLQTTETPSDSKRGERSAWLLSLVFHASFLGLISLLTIQVGFPQPTLVLTAPIEEEIELEELKPEEFHFAPVSRELIGASVIGGARENQSEQVEVSEFTQVPSLELPAQVDVGQVQAREILEATSGGGADLSHSVKGTAGVGVTGADGAIERLTHEIMLSLEEQDTLVVWFFDRSASLQTQRKSILKRFNRVYEELGVIQEASDRIHARIQDAPLLTSVVAFGQDVEFLTKRPTDDLSVIKLAVSSIERDDSGIENVFEAIQAANTRLRRFRSQDRAMMYIVFTDEAGDDFHRLDACVEQCRNLAIPVYVVGTPAPFGRHETLVKWVDPDPKYDQSVQWGQVNQGPESLYPERVKLLFSRIREDDTPIDSGFGPFALTRLCYETGGIFFTVHPNRATGQRVSRRETDVFSAHFSTFFDPAVMRRYRPEYVSAKEYLRRVQASPARQALLKAAERSWLQPLEPPRSRFVVRNEAAFSNELTEAQKVAARMAPVVGQLQQILQQGEPSRASEITPRWQAAFDLAIGRVLATKVRAEAYNEMLAKAKRGQKFSDAKNNTWTIVANDEIATGSRLKREADRAHDYLTRVCREHEGTPWALLAKRELDVPMGWRWQESYTELNPQPERTANNNNSPPTPRDDQVRNLSRPVEKRAPPRL